jgi:hypothetical protein
MVLWVCTSCETKYAVGLLACPRCAAFEYLEEGSIVPKSTTGGVSNVHAGPDEVGYAAVEEPAAAEADAPAAAATEPAEEAEGPAEGSEQDVAGAAPPRPASAATKDEWIAYVIAAGADPGDAAGMTKKDLLAWEPPAPGDVGAELTITAEAKVTRGDAEEQGA